MNVGIALFTPQCTRIQSLYAQISKRYDLVLGAIVDSVNGDHVYFGVRGTPFYAPRGRTYRHKAVGRWPDLHQHTSTETGFRSVSQGPNASDLLSVRSTNPTAILTLSDAEPLELYQQLSASYNVPKCGIIGAQTPFVNGNPFTLFYDNEVKKEGAVGVFIEEQITLQSFQDGFKPISDTLQITKCRGNIINQLGQEKASGSLLKSKTKMVFKIIGGDVSKGTLALDTTLDLQPSMTCQFAIHEQQSTPVSGLVFSTMDTDSPVKSELGIVTSYPSIFGQLNSRGTRFQIDRTNDNQFQQIS
ncbi:hypothetical protein EDD86DRAFT_244814 [Gorgonomyces haynaldii]|nr:hypothetical protein EDD86DRAFT_244814 [Gorgonomyces haynaldii]